MAALTAARVRELLTYDELTGVFTRRIAVGRHGRFRAGDVVGTPNVDGYLVAMIDGHKVYMHRVAVLYVTGEWPPEAVDHRDGARANNCWANLRCATRAINSQNLRKARVDNRSGLLGVKKRRYGFSARIQAQGSEHNLGSHRTAEAAHAAYVAAKRQLHEGNTL